MGGKGGGVSRRVCEICGYREKDNPQKMRLFAHFPLNPALCKEWVRNTGNEDLAYLPIEKLHQLKYVCGVHFPDKQFNKQRSRLKKKALPVLKVVARPLTDEQLADFPLHLWRGKPKPDPQQQQHTEPIKKEQDQVTPNVHQGSQGVDQDTPDVCQSSQIVELVDEDTPDDFVGQESLGVDQNSQDGVESPCPSPEVADEEPQPAPVPCRCQLCGRNVDGSYNFACASCAGFVLCLECVVDGAHAACYVLRVPPQRPQSEVRAVVRAVRGALAMESFADDLGAPLVDEGPVEIKSENELSDVEDSAVREEQEVCEVAHDSLVGDLDPLAAVTPAPLKGMPMVLSIVPNAAGGFILNTNTETVEPETDETEYQVEALDSDFESPFQHGQSDSDDDYVPEEPNEDLESQSQTTLRLHSIQQESESNHPAMRGKAYEMRPRVLNQSKFSDSVHRSPREPAPKLSQYKVITTEAGSSLPPGPGRVKTMVPILRRLPTGVFSSKSIKVQATSDLSHLNIRSTMPRKRPHDPSIVSHLQTKDVAWKLTITHTAKGTPPAKRSASEI